MAKVWLGPSGQLVSGHVLDVSVKPFQQALKDYDRQLYVKWNPMKLKGWGCWEIRRQPENKSVVDIAEFEPGKFILRMEYAESPMVHHILDCAFLNYDAIRKIKEMDTWVEGIDGWAERLEKREEAHKAKVKAKARDEMRYMGKQFKSQMQGFREHILSGGNPADIAQYWDDKHKRK